MPFLGFTHSFRREACRTGQSIRLGGHGGVFRAALFHLGRAGAPGFFGYVVHDHRDVGAAAPPGGLL